MGEFDELKGRAKEAAGDLTGDEDLKREGKIDQAAGKVKDLVERVSDKIKGVLRRDNRLTRGSRSQRRRRLLRLAGHPERQSPVPGRGHLLRLRPVHR